MNNDDDTYRRHVYPAITKCVQGIKSNTEPSPNIFKTAVLKSYNNYIQEYPIRELPDQIDHETCEAVCSKMHEEVCKDYSEGKTKD